jgi:hypothetical protein
MIHIFHKWGEWQQIGQSHYYKRTCTKCKRHKVRSIGFLRMFD